MTKDATPTYADLPRYAEIRSNELSALLASYIDMTDRYGEVLCTTLVSSARLRRDHRATPQPAT
jgi:hypothetical protein